MFLFSVIYFKRMQNISFNLKKVYIRNDAISLNNIRYLQYL